MVCPNLPVSAEQIAEFCRRHHIRQLSLFGSVLRDDFRADSDVDVLVEFEPGCHPGLYIGRVEEGLSTLFGGHKVDLVNPDYLHEGLRRSILSSRQVAYEQG